MENIFTVSKPFLALGRFLGLFPASYQQSGNKKYFKVSIPGIFSTCCAISIFSYLVIANYMQRNRPLYKLSEISSISQVFMRNFELFSYMILCIYQVGKWRKIVEFLKLIEKADDEVSFWLLISFQFKRWSLCLGKVFDSAQASSMVPLRVHDFINCTRHQNVLLPYDLLLVEWRHCETSFLNSFVKPLYQRVPNFLRRAIHPGLPNS